MVENINNSKYNVGFAGYNAVNINVRPVSYRQDAVSFNHEQTTKQTNPVVIKDITSQYSPTLLSRIYSNENFINELVNRNKNVSKILSSVGIDNPKVSMKNISGRYENHIQSTTAIAMQIADMMNISQADRKTLELAATFHDFGKALMPEEILNKNSSLTDEERKIIATHSSVGAELLETAGMSKRVTDLIRNHHNKQTTDKLCNILSVADKYSALMEERCYKKALTKQEALKILDQEAMGGEVSTEVLNALKSALNKNKVA